MSVPDAGWVAEKIHEHARPSMIDDHWCINAAAITRDVLRELGVTSYAVAADAIHMNAAYVHAMKEVERTGVVPADPPEGQLPYLVAARVDGDFDGFNVKGPEPKGQPFNGHVITFVPAWVCYLDPSADQFARPDQGIELTPGAWTDANEPFESSMWSRLDGGWSIITPKRSRSFVNTPAWSRRGDPDQRALVQRIVDSVT